MKVCSKCKIPKNELEFPKRKKEKDGYNPWCKLCINKYNKGLYLKNGRKNRICNPERNRESKLKWKTNNPEKVIEIRRRDYKNCHNKCLDYYGHKCALCPQIENLVIDHIGGYDGKSPRGGISLWRWLIKSNFPPGFRVLCMRCNTIDGALRSHPLLNLRGIDDLLNILKNTPYIKA
jgi:hypothetical protein